MTGGMTEAKSAAAMLNGILDQAGISQRKLAGVLGVSPQLLNSRLKKDTFPANDWMEAVRATGYEILLVPGTGEKAAIQKRTEGICPAFKKTVDGVQYDKASSTALGHQWFDGGVRELYQAESGSHFIITLLCWPSLKISIQVVDEEAAGRFLKDGKTIVR